MQHSSTSQSGFSLSRMFRFKAIGHFLAACCVLVASSAWAIAPSVTTDIAGNNLTGVPYDLGQTYIYAPPSLASVTPSNGAQGATIASLAIVGTNTNFVQGTSVLTFSGTGITVNTLTVTDATHATANITITGAAATTARDVTVTTSTEVATLTAGFTVTTAVPTVTSLATTSGPTAGGTTVVITGTNLSGATGVKFGTTSATGLTANTATTSATNAGDQYTYVALPTVTSLATTSGPTAGGTTVVITGTNLSAATGVKFGTTSATGLTANTATSITVTAPAGSAGTVDVTVTTAGGTSATNAGDQFTYVAAPTVTSLATTSGPTAGGTTVVITGTNLSAATGVKFGTTSATGLTANTATSITVTAPAGSAGTVDVTVTTAGGTSATNAGDQYTYVALPT
ncbi:MAG: hypothetical protein B7Z52_00740, partial [Burkholderiales bacterium 12-64-5]